MNENKDEGMRAYVVGKAKVFREWLKPDPTDKLAIQIVKSFFKGIVMLIMLALSPVILVVLIFVFFAAL